MSSEKIKNLVRQAQNGDAEAFGELYSLYAGDMYRFALYYTSSATLAEDAVSDAVLLAFKKLGQLKNPASFKAWQFSILFNCCREQQREKSEAMKRTELSDAAGILQVHSDMGENAALRAALKRLADDEREILLLSGVFGYKSREIAKMLGMKSATVRSKLSRTTAKMRQMIE